MRLRPSAAHRWLSCTASVADIERYEREHGPAPSSVYAEEGTYAHAMFANALEPRFHPEAPLPFPEEYDPDMPHHIEQCVEYVDALRGKDGLMWCELEVGATFGPEVITGTADVVVLDGTTLHVVDLKYGRGERVGVVGNPQLVLYALGAREFFDLTGDPVERVVLHILQPRVPGGFQSWEMREITQANFETTVSNALRDLAAGDTNYAPSEATCRWCPVKASCAALREATVGQLAQHFESDEADLAGSELGDLLDLVKLTEQFIASVREEAQARLLDGEEIPGWKLVVGRTNRRWSDDAAVLEVFKASKVGRDAYEPRKLVSPAQAFKVVKPSSLTYRRLNELVVQPPGRPTLAEEDDKRPDYVQVQAEIGEFE